MEKKMLPGREEYPRIKSFLETVEDFATGGRGYEMPANQIQDNPNRNYMRLLIQLAYMDLRDQKIDGRDVCGFDLDSLLINKYANQDLITTLDGYIAVKEKALREARRVAVEESTVGQQFRTLRPTARNKYPQKTLF